jgi:hypothetical protein
LRIEAQSDVVSSSLVSVALCSLGVGQSATPSFEFAGAHGCEIANPTAGGKVLEVVQVIEYVELFPGTIYGASVHPREVVANSGPSVRWILRRTLPEVVRIHRPVGGVSFNCRDLPICVPQIGEIL